MKPRTDTWVGDERLTRAIIGAFYYVYNRLGPGSREAIYMAALERVLIRRGFRVGREVVVPIHFDHEIIGYQRADMIVEDRIVVEGKVFDGLQKIDASQLFSYLRATTLENGLLFYFGNKPQFFRIVCENQRKSLANPQNVVVSAKSASTEPSNRPSLTEPRSSE
jgi:GxxExxY protein